VILAGAFHFGTASEATSPIKIYHLEAGSVDERTIQSLTPGATALGQAPDEAFALAKVYLQALEHRDGTAGAVRYLASVGPVLDSGDQVHSQELTRHGNHITWPITYTHNDDPNKELRKNIVWRPILLYPIPKAWLTGAYSLEVRWLQINKPEKTAVTYKFNFFVNSE
jgi:hypothetical protein